MLTNSLPFLLVLLAIQAMAQPPTIRGSLKTRDGQAISHASVTIRNTKNRIVAFKSSDSEGNFVLVLPRAAQRDSLILYINHLGFAKVDIPLVTNRSHYDLILAEKPIDLSEVDVKSRPRVISRGDTLSYEVGSFAKPEDRSIGDVLRRMPGMEVSESGQIKYNGRHISNFYIDGDDLLNDKYRIGTKTIPYAMVQKLEVLQNHQPITVLRNKAFSDRVAINLVIKDEAQLELTGQAKLGAGLPHQYDGELNTILFNKQYKMLNVAKGNNTGDDLAEDFTAFHYSDRLSAAGNSRPKALLAPGTAGNPMLPKQRYYFNKSGSLNANNLMNLESGLQLKMNINGLIDKNDFVYNNRSELYLGDDTIRYTERQDIWRSPFLNDVNFQATVNKEHYYLNHALKVTYAGETGASSLLSNDVEIDQRLRNRIRDFSHTLTYVPAMKSGSVIELYWYLNHYNRPEKLTIEPGINKGILNEGKPFERIQQFAETPTWFNRVSAAYRLTDGVIRQRYRLGVINEWQRLRSALRLTQMDGQETAYTGSDDNHLHWNRHQLFMDGLYEYKRGNWEMILTLPFVVQRIAYRDGAFALEKSEGRLLFNPSFHAKLMTNVEDHLSLNYGYNQEMGNINGVFRGAVLINYRSIEANDADLRERENHAVGLQYNFQRAIRMLFVNAGITYTKSMANTIASSIVNDTIARTILLPFNNDISSVAASGGVSKYIFALGATASLKASWSISRFNQLLNGEAIPFSNRSITVDPAVEARLFNKVSILYSGTGVWTTSRLINREATVLMESRQIRQLKQSVGLTYSPLKNTFLRVEGQHQYTSQHQLADIRYFFVDANIRHRLARWRMDMELDLTNLTNITSYETYSLSANRQGYSSYRLRGRMAVLKCTVNL